MDNNKFTNVLVFGSIAFDEIADFSGKFVDYINPEKLHQINISFNLNTLKKSPGGIATNISYNLSLLTDVPVSVLGAVGTDGKSFLDFFRQHNIHMEGVLVDESRFTASGRGVADTMDNQIWTYYYGACEKAAEIELSIHINNASLLIISSNHKKAITSILKQAVQESISYLFDPAFSILDIEAEDLRDGVFHARWVVGNDYEIALIEKRLSTTVADIAKKNIGVITTLGAQGVKYQDSKQEFIVPAFKTEAKDPSGAGDAWRGGFVSALLEEKTVEDALRMGNAIASFAVEQYGTTNHKPTKQEVLKRARSL